jgi:type IV pilus assembly protein PilB
MRQDPDVMLIGEIRDKETAELAVRASITGHLVLSTLHTNDAVGAIPRLLDLGIASYQISSGILAVIAQNLVRKLCEKCKQPRIVTREELEKKGVSSRILNLFETYTLYQPVGCIHCRGTGYNRREAVTEIFEIDEDIKTMITKEASAHEISYAAQQKGMFSIREDGELKVLLGKTTFEELDRVLN